MRFYDKDRTPHSNSFFSTCLETAQSRATATTTSITKQEAGPSFTHSPNHQNSQYIFLAYNLPPHPHHARISALSPHSSANPSKGRA